MAAVAPEADKNRPTNHYVCCVPKCTSDGRRDDGLSFHRFPCREEIRKQWIVKIRRDIGENFKITSNTRVSSRHFDNDQYEEEKDICGRRRLKKHAIPNQFAWTINKPAPRRVLVRKSPDAIINRCTTRADVCEGEIIRTLKEEIEDLKARLSAMKIYKFGCERFTNDSESIKFYTGFPSYKHFILFYEFVQPSAETMTYYYGSYISIGRPGIKKMLLIDELFLFLVRIRLGLKLFDLAHRFNVSESTVSRKVITWANYLYFFLGMQPIWPSFDTVKQDMSPLFKMLYPTTHCIIDCTEIKVQVPTSLKLQSQMYSNYKSSTTLKGLIGITPNGAVCFISSLYTGSISDKEITAQSGILDLLEPHTSIMADKGFDIDDLLVNKTVDLNIPPYLSESNQLKPQEVIETKKIAMLRIHVERAIRRIKEYHIFDGIVPLSLLGSVNQLWTVSCLLTNFQGPSIKRDSPKA